MKKELVARVLAVLLVAGLLLSLLPAAIFAAGTSYVLDAATDLTAMPEYTKKDGDTLQAGTNNYFTIHFSEKTKIDSSSKTWEDGYASSQRLNFAGKAQISSTIKNCIQFTTASAATVKIWWACAGEGRQFGIFDAQGNVVVQTNVTVLKNDPAMSTLEIPAAGTYYLGGIENKNYIFKVEVTEHTGSSADPSRKAWADVAAPELVSAQDGGDGTLVVKIKAEVGADGGDALIVKLLDTAGKEVLSKRSVRERAEHSLTFEPPASGTYTVIAQLEREGEQAKVSANQLTAGFIYPLVKPIMLSATSKGGGSIGLVWTAVNEAEKYEVYMDGALIGTATAAEYTATGLVVGQEYSFHVKAIRGTESQESEPLKARATQNEQVVWGFTYYGPSTKADGNGYVGSLNETGSVTVFSESGKGKIVPANTDGLAFYYTAVPTTHNFTLRAKVTVDSWTYSNGQEGFGLMVTDRLGPSGDSAAFWNNQYMAVATKIEYRFDHDLQQVFDLKGSGTKYTMKLGLGAIAKTGVTPENLPLLEVGDTDAITKQFLSRMNALEWSAGSWGKDSGTYNIVGNATKPVDNTIENEVKTEFILEIQKNNTGYFITYYDAEGKVLAQQKYYGADSLNKLDKDYVYAGFFAARNARATFSDVTFTTILASEDAPAEERPVTKIEPTVSVSSANVSTSQEYEFLFGANVDGWITVSLDDMVLVNAEAVQRDVRFSKEISLNQHGENRIKVKFTPDPNQNLGEDTVLSSTADIYTDITVLWNKGNYHRKNIYVSPEGLPTGTGSKEHPYDLYTAVTNVVPGQTIVLMEGTYLMTQTLKIQRGMDGTAELPIRMIADPEAATRPVLDFQTLCAGIVHGGNYWYFAGFDVTNSQAGQKGFQVSGNYNTLDKIHTYHNGNTGIQISRYSGSDTTVDQWPSYNLILNCLSYGNADPGYEDADGFAAKLTCGVGNVFDGCVAYNNADDGWDLYAKVETGCIGAVTIRNCVAYANGILEDGTIGGNGNGFKLGGESLSGKHVLENSYAFFNRAKGIDSNSCPDVIVRNCVSYNNGSYNVAFYTNNALHTDFSANGIISFKDATIPYADAQSKEDNLKGKGNQDEGKYINETNYYWTGAQSANADGNVVTADMFVSLEFKGVARNADGTIDMQGFLVVNEKAPANAGVVTGGQSSYDMTLLPEDEVHEYSNEWTTIDKEWHWRECECGDKTDIGLHEFVEVIDKEATPTETGLKHSECTVCGYKKAQITVYYEEQQPATPATHPSAPVQGDVEDNNGGILWVILAIAVVGGGAALVLLKKKKA